MAVDQPRSAQAANMQPGQSPARIVITQQSCPVTIQLLDQGDMMPPDGNHAIAPVIARPVPGEVEALVIDAEIEAQAAAAISMWTSCRPAADNGAIAVRDGVANVVVVMMPVVLGVGGRAEDGQCRNGDENA